MSNSQNPNRPYKNIETVFIKDLGAAGKLNFSRFINIPFNVDEVVVQSVISNDKDVIENTGDHTLISTDMLPGKKDLTVLYYVVDQARVCHTRFPMQGLPVVGNFNFQYSLTDGSQVNSPTTFHQSVAIELLFIQY